MCFNEVFYSFRNFGSLIRRSAWPDGVYYVVRETNLIEHWPDGHERPVMALFVVDILADDWELINL